MSSEQCDACGSKNIETILGNLVHDYTENGKQSAWSYSFLKCNACGMGFISPKPSWKRLQTFYSADYGCYNPASGESKSESKSLKYTIAKLRFASTFKKGIRPKIATALGRVAELLSGRVVSYSLGIPLQLPKDARILELGYGNGNWLLSMGQLGYKNLHGYDIDANIENKSRLESAGVLVHNGDFLNSAYPDNHFDCVRLEHVFEHLLEPKAIFKELYRIMKPGGVLVMSFPGINAFSFSLSPQQCALRDSPRHLYLHTPVSASNILSAARFKMEGVRQYGIVLLLELTINNMLKENNLPPVIHGFALFAPFYNILNLMARRGEFITVLASK